MSNYTPIHNTVTLFLRTCGYTLLAFLWLNTISLPLYTQANTKATTETFEQSQDPKIRIKNIVLKGNRRTKAKVIKRELSFEKGDTLILTQLDEIFDRSRLQLLSTGLFNNVKLNLSNYQVKDEAADIEITLEENWYFFPVPIFELADRNFNVWLKEQEASFRRTNYGVRLGYYNTTGNKDPLKFVMHFGYTKKYELNYTYPYLMMDDKLGIAGAIFYSENKEIGYKTVGNKTLFEKLEDERKLLSRFRTGPQLKYRPSLNSYHGLRLEYHHNKIDPYVATELNPDYFLGGATDLRFFYIEYDYNYDKRLYSQYPVGGYLLFGNIKKEGLGLFKDYNNLSVEVGFEKHHNIKKRLILSTRNKFKTNLSRNTVAFANNTGLGWGTDIVSGYELYVMDGTDFVITMNDIKYKILQRNLKTARWLPEQFRKMNLIIFLRANIDAAYVNERTYKETNNLNNKWIYGGGPALDLIIFNNYRFTFEYSFNDIGEQGLFLQNAITF